MTACFALHVGRCSPFLFITFNFFSFFLQVSNIILIFASESPEVPEAIHTPGLSFSYSHVFLISYVTGMSLVTSQYSGAFISVRGKFIKPLILSALYVVLRSFIIFGVVYLMAKIVKI